MALPNDKALRRLVGELAMASQQDVQLVLAELDDKQRAAIGLLLAEHPDHAEPRPVTPPVAESLLPIDGLSTWLAERLASARATSPQEPAGFSFGGLNDPVGVRMTKGALGALQSCAEDLLASATLKPAQLRARSSGWASRLLGFAVPRTVRS